MKGSIRLIALGFCAAAIFLSSLGTAAAAEPAWSVQESPNGFGSTGDVLRDAACPGYYPGTNEGYLCFGVGNSTTASGSRPLLLLGNKTFWSDFSFELPSSAEYPGAVLESISCFGETFCLAVGYYTPKASQRKPLAVRMNSEFKWTWQKPAIPGTDEFTELTGVSCTSATSCEAVGTTKATSGATSSKTLAEHSNGSTWSIKTSYSSASGENALTDVSCTSSTSCLAVGRTGTSTLGEVYSGTEWKQAGTGIVGSLEGVSCTAASACTAVGQIGTKIAARRWNGTTWATQTTVGPPGATLSIGSDVSCISATGCVAVGHYDSEGASHPLAERWNGTTWSQDSVPAAKGSSAGTLLGVSCMTSTLCVAVGDSTISGVLKTLVEIYS
jgi:hypothetical protein